MLLDFNWLDHICALVLIVILPLLSFKTREMGPDSIEELPPKKHLFYTNGLILIISALLVLTFWNINKRPFYSMGFKWPFFDQFLIGLILSVVLIYLSDTFYALVNKSYKEKKISELSHLIPLNWREYGHFVFLAFSAGISEEIIFRGFLMLYLQHFLTDFPYSYVVVMVLPALVFSISHLYQGWWAVLKIFAIALLFGWIFIYSGSLLIVMVIHILIDLISGLMGIGAKIDFVEEN